MAANRDDDDDDDDGFDLHCELVFEEEELEPGIGGAGTMWKCSCGRPGRQGKGKGQADAQQ